jgi:hypothetical protein
MNDVPGKCVICEQQCLTREQETNLYICDSHEYTVEQLRLIAKANRSGWGIKMASQVTPDIVAVIRNDSVLELYHCVKRVPL